MELSDVSKLKKGDKVRLKDSRDKFSTWMDQDDVMLEPGMIVLVEVIDIGEHTNLQIGGHYEGGTGIKLWMNYESVEEVKDELSSSE